MAGVVRTRSFHELPRRWASVLLLVLLILVFMLGGSAQRDLEVIRVLWPAGVVGLGLAALGVMARDLRGFLVPLLIAAAGMILPLLQLVPLPPALWQSLPGRDLIVAIDHFSGLGVIWRPLSLTPRETLAALFAAMIPLAVLLLAIQLKPVQQARLVLVVLTFGLISAGLGLLQILSDRESALYLFEITNNGSPVGLFANRNHQAVVLACMLPLGFAAAHTAWRQGNSFARASRHLGHDRRMAEGMHRRSHWPLALAVVGACLLVPIVLLTGSRSGLLMTAVALISTPFVLGERLHNHTAAPPSQRRSWISLALLIIAGVIAAAVMLDRDIALDRLMASTPTDDLRLQMLPTVLDMARQYWIWGTGLGSFERVYQVHETTQLLMPEYVNHAHNDWLELLITGGVPAIGLALALLAAIAMKLGFYITETAPDAWHPLRRAALVCVCILGLSSLSDYPLRTPFVSAFFALCLLWLFMPKDEFSINNV